MLISGVAVYLLAPALSIFPNMTTALSAREYWTEPYSIAAVSAFMVALGVRAVLSARGRWLGVFSVGMVAVLAYLSVPVLVFLVAADLEAAYVAVMIFGIGSAWTALIIGWTHGVWTRRLYLRAHIQRGSLERTRYGL